MATLHVTDKPHDADHTEQGGNKGFYAISDINYLTLINRFHQTL